MGVVTIEGRYVFLRDIPIGYLTDEHSAVVDENKLGSYANRWLMQHGYAVDWQSGVEQQLVQERQAEQLRTRVRIYQPKAGLRQLLDAPKTPSRESHVCVYDGDLGTADLEEIFMILNTNHPPDYHAPSLSVGDVVELYDAKGSSFHMVDVIGFHEVQFGQEQPEETQNLKL